MEGLENSAKNPERISQAAIQFGNEFFKGNTHADAALTLGIAHPQWWKIEGKKTVEGFMTSSGRFVNRDEAGVVAHKAEQTPSSEKLDSFAIKELRPKDLGDLDSEELEELYED